MQCGELLIGGRNEKLSLHYTKRVLFIQKLFNYLSNSRFHKVILAPFDGITRQTCFVLRSKNSSNYPFDLFTAFQDSTVQYSSNRSTGSTIPYATWDHALVMMPIFRPPDTLIKQFCDASVPLLDSIQVMLKKNANLRQARDLLLPKLISGEIDVSELDIDSI